MTDLDGAEDLLEVFDTAVEGLREEGLDTRLPTLERVVYGEQVFREDAGCGLETGVGYVPWLDKLVLSSSPAEEREDRAVHGAVHIWLHDRRCGEPSREMQERAIDLEEGYARYLEMCDDLGCAVRDEKRRGIMTGEDARVAALLAVNGERVEQLYEVACEEYSEWRLRRREERMEEVRERFMDAVSYELELYDEGVESFLDPLPDEYGYREQDEAVALFVEWALSDAGYEAFRQRCTGVMDQDDAVVFRLDTLYERFGEDVRPGELCPD